MRVKAVGKDKGKAKTVIIDIQDTYDKKTEFLAMEKWTGWHASIVMIEILKGNIGSGAISIENALSGKVFYRRALDRSYDIQIQSS